MPLKTFTRATVDLWKLRFGYSCDVVTNANGVYYLHRRIFWFGIISVRFHTFLQPDDTHRGIHDHPWAFLTYVRSGAYYAEVTDPKMETDRLVFKGWHYRPRNFRHAIIYVRPGTKTIVITGPLVNRNWGFYDHAGVFTPAREVGESH